MMLESKNKKKSSSVSLNNMGLSVSPAETTPIKTQSLSRSFLGSVNKQSSKPSIIKEDKGGKGKGYDIESMVVKI